MDNKLLFFNADGNPYNFEYNETTKSYDGKLFFDKNSNDTFKSLNFYIFEEVKPIEFESILLLDKFEIYNYSGVSFIPFTYSGETITNINKVNSADDFYSKWIYGDNFDTKFPKGTIVSFSGLSFTTSTTDFTEKYYTVIDNKPGSILINTATENSSWSNTFITGGTISSHNIVSYNDYDDSLITYLNGETLYSGKKISVTNSLNNDAVNSYIDKEYNKTFYQTYTMSGVTDDILKINFTLKTERAKIYQGPVEFILDGATAYLKFTRGLNNTINLEEGEQIIFESYNDEPIIASNPTFTIIDGVTDIDLFTGDVSFVKELNTNKSFMRHFNSKDVSSQNFIKSTTLSNFNQNKTTISSNYPSKFFEYDYYLQITGTTTSFAYTLEVNDIILLSGTTSGSTNDNRKLKVKKIETFYEQRIEYWENKISNSESWLSTVRANSVTNERTLKEEMEIESIKMYNSYDNNSLSDSYIAVADRTEKIFVNNYVIEEIENYIIRKNLTIDQIDTITCSYSPTVVYSAFTMDVVAYDTSNILSFEQTIVSKSGSTTGTTEVDYNKTIELFNNKYSDYLLTYGILVYEKDDLLNIHSIYSLNDNENYFDATVYINNDSSITETSGITDNRISNVVIELGTQLVSENIYPNDYENFATDFNTEIYFDLSNNQNNFGFNIELNDVDYYIQFTTDTTTTINNFISTYYSIFNNMGLDLYSGGTGTTLIIDALYPNYDYRTLEIKVNIFSSYEILSLNDENGIILSANILDNSDTFSFFDYGLSTGMIINLSGSTYPFNNGMYNIIGLYEDIIELSYQGVFIQEETLISIKTNTFLRKPRDSYTKDIYYNFRFDTPYSDTIFFYDFSGDHLKPYLDDDRFKYVGTKPLWDNSYNCDDLKLMLIDEPNKSIEFDKNGNVLENSSTVDPFKQQTVFKGTDGEYCLEFLLDEYDSTSEYDFSPVPLQVFLGYQSDTEGFQQTVLKMDKVENITFSGYTTDVEFDFSTSGLLEITTNEPNFNFMNYGFEKGQKITIDFIDQQTTGTTIFPNYGTFDVEIVSTKSIKVNSGSTGLSGFTTTGTTEDFKYIINVEPKNILTLNIYGETEIEDERFNINLKNLGIDLNYDIEHIFKESDIEEDGINYTLLNAKRKEMLSMYPEIYNYIGSYKAIINSINFFGWSDLGLNEYYKNINPTSELYQKLQKVEINDIFDNTVDGWVENDYVKGKYKSGDYKKTNLFNLTYNITDEHGNNTILYSLKDVQIKLNKLKRWLKRNVVPLSSNLVDITGVADVDTNLYLNFDVSNQSTKNISTSKTSVVNFIFNKTLNFENNYLFEINFYTITGVNLSGWTAKIQTFSLSTDGTNKLIPQKYFKLLKNDLLPYSFNIDSTVDEYLYIETTYYNEYGLGQVYNQMIDTSTSKNYLLVNNSFNIPTNYDYLNVGDLYYFFDEQGYIYLKN